MSAFVDGLTKHNLASADVQVRIYPGETTPIALFTGDFRLNDSESVAEIWLTREQADELASVIRTAVAITRRPR